MTTMTDTKKKNTYSNEMTSLAHSRIGDLLAIIDAGKNYVMGIPNKLETPILVGNIKGEVMDNIMNATETAEDEILAWLKSIIKRCRPDSKDESKISFHTKCDLETIDRNYGFKLSKTGLISQALKECNKTI